MTQGIQVPVLLLSAHAGEQGQLRGSIPAYCWPVNESSIASAIASVGGLRVGTTLDAAVLSLDQKTMDECIQFAKMLKAFKAPAKLIAIVGDTSIAHLATEAGFDAVLVRPVDKTKLNALLLKYVRDPNPPTCPECDKPLMAGDKLKAWMASGPAPIATHKCAGCQVTYFEFEVTGGKPLLVNLATCPPGYPMGDFIQDKLAERK